MCRARWAIGWLGVRAGLGLGLGLGLWARARARARVGLWLVRANSRG